MNEEQFKELIKKYQELITFLMSGNISDADLKEIANGNWLSRKTGFRTKNCTLCVKASELSQLAIPVVHKCNYCLHGIGVGFNFLICNSQETYHKLEKANTIDSLIKALKSRVNFLQKILDNYELQYKSI